MPGCFARFVLTAAASVSLLPGTASACSEALLLEPPAGQRLSGPDGEVLLLKWRPIDGITEYRLQARGRMPEGGTVWSVDLMVSGYTHRLVLPAHVPLMALKLRVSSACAADGDAIRAQPARVLIESR